MSQTDMEKDKYKNELFFHIKKISEINKQAGGYNDLFLEFAKPHLEYFCGLLNINSIAAVLYANLTYLYRGTTVSIDQLADYMHLSCIEIIQYMGELEILEDKDLICIHKTTRDFFLPVFRKKFSLN